MVGSALCVSSSDKWLRHRASAQCVCVCVTDCYFIVNVLDLPCYFLVNVLDLLFASPMVIYRYVCL